MTAYTVQFILPVDNPANNVRKTMRKGHIWFEVPLNLPNAHNVTLAQLLEFAERSGLLGLSTHLNNKTGLQEATHNIKRA